MYHLALVMVTRSVLNNKDGDECCYFVFANVALDASFFFLEILWMLVW